MNDEMKEISDALVRNREEFLTLKAKAIDVSKRMEEGISLE